MSLHSSITPTQLHLTTNQHGQHSRRFLCAAIAPALLGVVLISPSGLKAQPRTVKAESESVAVSATDNASASPVSSDWTLVKRIVLSPVRWINAILFSGSSDSLDTTAVGTVTAYDQLMPLGNITSAPQSQLLLVRTMRTIKGREASRYIKIVYKHGGDEASLPETIFDGKSQWLFKLKREYTCDSSVGQIESAERQSKEGDELSLPRLKWTVKTDILADNVNLPCYVLTPGKLALDRGEPSRNRKMTIGDLSDEQVVEKIASQNQLDASQAFQEAFRRGARVIPLLLKHRGDRRFYFGDRLGSKITGDYKIEPADTSFVRLDETTIETVDVASLYLISAIYFGSLEYAHSAFLLDTNAPEGERDIANTDALLYRAWESTQKWASELRERGFDVLKCKEKRGPLHGSGVRFYGSPSAEHSGGDLCGPPVTVVNNANDVSPGTVKLRVLISKTGEVVSVRPVLGDPTLYVAATRAVHKMKFQPQKLSGRPIETEMIVTVTLKRPMP